MSILTGGKRIFIARHGETIFNAAGRMQGMKAHTPLTREGFEQAVAMGQALSSHIHPGDRVQLVASNSGRTLQTLGLVAGEAGLDWHAHRIDDRLREIDVGEWEGRFYADIASDISDFVDMEYRLFTRRPPGGEDYADVARRLQQWISEQDFQDDMLLITHGMTARVLRGLLLGLDIIPKFGAPIAHGLSQGSMVMIRDGQEELIISGDGSGERA